MAGEPLNDRLVEGTLKFGGGSVMMWGYIVQEGAGYAYKIDGKMDADLYVQILDPETLSFNKIMTRSIPAKRHRGGSKTME